MNQDTAYNVMMGWASRAKVRAWMQKTVTGEWDVVVAVPGKRERTFSTREAAVAFWRECKAEGKIPA